MKVCSRRGYRFQSWGLGEQNLFLRRSRVVEMGGPGEKKLATRTIEMGAGSAQVAFRDFHAREKRSRELPEPFLPNRNLT